ncbi:MAG: CPBP family intramembrane glutamic endopeptidase [Planctomycetaceae bacterium]|nr:CPBP family intramembrane glutamic endopeptidase [Planctomycetaceae bacterium]
MSDEPDGPVPDPRDPNRLGVDEPAFRSVTNVPLVLSDADFFPGPEPQHVSTHLTASVEDDHAARQRVLNLPGPGLPEALGWTFGLLTAHVGAAVAMLLVIAGLMFLSGEWHEGAFDLQARPDLNLLLVGGGQMLVLLISVIAAACRCADRLSTKLNFSVPHPLHSLIIVGLMLPLSSVSGGVYWVAHRLWLRIVDACPPLRIVDSMNTVEAMGELTMLGSLPIMLVIFAVGPALGEELIFRGVIGRGLVARWGLTTGVVITSLLFAVMHLHPAHVLGVIPLGIAMHLIYLSTRSFWAPVMLHFLNNSWATVASRMSQASQLDPALVDGAPSVGLLIASCVAVIVLGTLLYHTRTRYVLMDGAEWTPGYLTVEAPPEGVESRIDHGLWSHRTLVAAATAWASFAVAFAAEIVAFAR